MTPHDLDRIRQHPDFIQLVRRKQRLTWSSPPPCWRSTSAAGGLRPGAARSFPQRWGHQRRHAGGRVIILLAFGLTGIYVARTNRVLDPLNDKLKQECAP